MSSGKKIKIFFSKGIDNIIYYNIMISMVKYILLLLAIIFALPVDGGEIRRACTFEDAYRATCRVSAGNSRGTGTFNGFTSDGSGIVTTNAHVVGNSQNVILDFWTNGKQETARGVVIARFFDARRPSDFAIIKISKGDIDRISPPYVALGGTNSAPAPNSYFYSAGAPKGRYVSAWVGKTLSDTLQGSFSFQPGPVPGQSGSAIISRVNGELWQTGILTWLIGNEGADDSKGGAIPISSLYAAASGRAQAVHSEGRIPSGAKECAEHFQAPAVLCITAPDCPPCVQAKKEVTSLRKNGVRVYLWSNDTPAGVTVAKRYSVKYTPTFVLVNDKWQEQKRYIGAGHRDDIELDFKALVKDSKESIKLTNDLNGFYIDLNQKPDVYEVAGPLDFLSESQKKWEEKLQKKESQPLDTEKLEENDKKTGLIIDKIQKDVDALNVNIVDKISETIDEKLAKLKRKILALLILCASAGCALWSIFSKLSALILRKAGGALENGARAILSRGENLENFEKSGPSLKK